MDETTFWNMVETAKAEANGNGEAQVKRLIEMLVALPVEEILSYETIFNTYHAAAYHWDLWGVAYIIGGGCSNDSFMDFRAWLIAQGREIYYKILVEPDTLVDIVTIQRDGRLVWGAAFLEDMNYVAMFAYEIKTGKELMTPSYPDSRKPLGEDWKEEDLPNLFPKVWAKFEHDDDKIR